LQWSYVFFSDAGFSIKILMIILAASLLLGLIFGDWCNIGKGANNNNTYYLIYFIRILSSWYYKFNSSQAAVYKVNILYNNNISF
jgi:hypothetical protein